MKELPAGDIHDGWICIPHPAADAGWHQIDRARHSGGWSEFHYGRTVNGQPVPYTTASHLELYWNAFRPRTA